MRNQTRDIFGRALLKLMLPRFRGSWRDDLVDMLKAGPCASARLVLASWRTGTSVSDLLLIARLRRRMDALAKKVLDDAATQPDKIRYEDNLDPWNQAKKGGTDGA
jgi:hypothetical protein